MDHLIDLIGQYGYFALFGLLAVGIAGLPIPDETLMATVGMLASHGTLSYPISIVVCFAGSMTGMIVSYALGRKLGKPFMYKYGKWFRLTPPRLEKAEAWFQKYGVWTVSFGYFIPGIRHFTCYLSGVTGIKFWRYLVYAGSGALIWVTTFITLGYFIRENIHHIFYLLHKYMGGILAIVAILVAVIIFLVMRYRRKTNA
ncbi:DedA family protein [Paenibacillus sp. y28]|uniref:DedA family protein n=1 Tax=Paenibacillus sp. y28 TaxID=3129110 RepID=UPI0030170482